MPADHVLQLRSQRPLLIHAKSGRHPRDHQPAHSAPLTSETYGIATRSAGGMAPARQELPSLRIGVLWGTHMRRRRARPLTDAARHAPRRGHPGRYAFGLRSGQAASAFSAPGWAGRYDRVSSSIESAEESVQALFVRGSWDEAEISVKHQTFGRLESVLTGESAARGSEARTQSGIPPLRPGSG